MMLHRAIAAAIVVAGVSTLWCLGHGHPDFAGVGMAAVVVLGLIDLTRMA